MQIQNYIINLNSNCQLICDMENFSEKKEKKIETKKNVCFIYLLPSEADFLHFEV